MNKQKTLTLIFSLLLIILFSSCREEIISPDSHGNINEPLLTVTNNSYTFLIHASNMNTMVIDRTYLQFSKTRVYSLVTDHSSGYVGVKVQTNNDNVVFAKVYSSDTRGTFDNIEGSQPDVITFNFNNFSGRLRLQLSRID